MHGIFYVDIINQQFSDYITKQKEFARNILYTNIMYLQASTDVKTSIFGEKWQGLACESGNGSLKNHITTSSIYLAMYEYNNWWPASSYLKYNDNPKFLWQGFCPSPFCSECYKKSIGHYTSKIQKIYDAKPHTWNKLKIFIWMLCHTEY